MSSLQARVENEILDYKDLAALPKVKAIYEVQQPDLIPSSNQQYPSYFTDDRLDTYIYGEVLLFYTLKAQHSASLLFCLLAENLKCEPLVDLCLVDSIHLFLCYIYDVIH